MAAKGAIEKETIQKKILSTFEGSFVCGKDIRVPINGMEVKITLTAAKDVLGVAPTSASMDTSADDAGNDDLPWSDTPVTGPNVHKVEPPSAEEMQQVADLMAALGL